MIRNEIAYMDLGFAFGGRICLAPQKYWYLTIAAAAKYVTDHFAAEHSTPMFLNNVDDTNDEVVDSMRILTGSVAHAMYYGAPSVWINHRWYDEDPDWDMFRSKEDAMWCMVNGKTVVVFVQGW